MKTPTFDTLLLGMDVRGMARLTLNRPDTHNALNATLIAELRQAAAWLSSAAGVRAVVLTGAGGNLGWLQRNMIYTADKLADAWETEEGSEGITAFFAKRAPGWRKG